MENGPAAQIGAELRAARARRRLTQRALAKKSGISAQSIQRFEQGLREPRVGQLISLANALDLTASSLLDSAQGTAVPA
ncbi:helix-turn-helix domain-containing protein [Nocardia xishanensis]